MYKIDDIQDDEIRVLGNVESSREETLSSQGRPPRSGRRKRAGIIAAAVIAAVASVAIVAFLCLKNFRTPPEDEPGFYDRADSTAIATRDESLSRLGDYSDTLKAYTEHISRTINDIPLEIYIPHNAVPRLFVGAPSPEDKNVVFTTQAADIRADNGKIVGAFVLKGEPLSWSISKKGYCGIIGGHITVGVAENSPLFEQATETGGYFFRQYPLVDNGVIVENAPKGKSVRKALCERQGEIFVAMSVNPESFHDFSEALADLGVSNAIYLVGSASYGYFRDRDDHLSIIQDKRWRNQRYENHLQWVTE